MDEVARLHSEREAAQSELVRLEQLRAALIVDGAEDEVIAHDAGLARARVRVEQVTAQHARAMQSKADADEAEEQARRKALYDRGRVAFRAGRDLYEREYPEAAKRLVDILRRIADQEEIVEAANRELPAGAVALEQVEPFNGFQAIPHSPIRPRVHLPGLGTGAAPFWPASKGSP